MNPSWVTNPDSVGTVKALAMIIWLAAVAFLGIFVGAWWEWKEHRNHCGCKHCKSWRHSERAAREAREVFSDDTPEW